MNKRTLLMVVSIVASLALVATGTLAYLTDTDSDVNVMTLGNVDIEQLEMKRDEDVANDATLVDGDLLTFEDGIKLYPAYPAAGDSAYAVDAAPIVWGPYVTEVGASNSLFDDASLTGAVDKMIFVENTGASEAYVRTFIAYEMPDGFDASKLVLVRNENTDDVEWNDHGLIIVEGTQYAVMSATYQQPLAAGAVSVPSLLQVALHHSATNDDMVMLGETYEILALSQAVQTENMPEDPTEALNAAFNNGKAVDSTALLTWFSAMEGLPVTTAATAEELAAALAEGGTVVLTDDITVTSTMNVAKGEDVVLILNGNDISYAVENDKASAIINNAGTMEITGEGTISFVAKNPDLGAIPAYATNTISNTGTLTIGEGVTVTNGSEGGASYAVDNHGVFTLDGGTLVGDRCALRIAKYNQDNVVFVMNSGRVEAKTPAWIQLPSSNPAVAPNISVTINGGTIESTKATSADNNVLYTYSYGNSHANTSITINGGEFLGGTVSIGSGYKGDAPELTINGGTFEYNVLQWLENDDSKVLYAANK